MHGRWPELRTAQTEGIFRVIWEHQIILIGGGGCPCDDPFPFPVAHKMTKKMIK